MYRDTNAFPLNEQLLTYSKGSEERLKIREALSEMKSGEYDIPAIIDGKEYRSGITSPLAQPHNIRQPLGIYHRADENLIRLAKESSRRAKKEWLNFSPWERIWINRKAADLITGKYRYILNAATMLNQSKNIHQAEIDAAAETADFFRFNAYFLEKMIMDQPKQVPGIFNKMDFRPLEGFVLAISPFNFTSIASNLAAAPALMGNSVIWKPASTSILSGYYLMKLYKEAGFPDGVINFIPAPGQLTSKLLLTDQKLGGIHFTGSTNVFRTLWKNVGNNINRYRSFPRLVGETGGKNFIIVHSSADINETVTAIIRGGFEYQGQKCSAASRVYLPSGLWPEIRDRLIAETEDIKTGTPEDFSNFMNAVIDETSFDNIMGYLDYAKESPAAEILTGGGGNKDEGFYIEPTIIRTDDPFFKTMTDEIFGPVVTVYVYNEQTTAFEEILGICDRTSPYALTGAIFAKERKITDYVLRKLRYSAGNFYINDKPTGAVVGQQPFGGSRASGTNDKAGSHLNLLRWTSPRTIKENLASPVDWRYPFMEE